MSYCRIQVQPMGALGAEVEGADLADLDGETFAEVRRAFLEHQVVVFHGQRLEPAGQVAFARRFGEIHHHPYIQGLDRHPEIIEIVKNEDDEHAFGSVWHSDQMFTPEPAMATALYARQVPDAGGDTLFASMYLGYDALSGGMKRLLSGLRAVNVGDGFRQRGGRTREQAYGNRSSMALKRPDTGQVTTVEHPVIRTHPETGRKALYIGYHTQRFAGMSEEESAPLLDHLRAHATRTEFTCRVRWAPGTLTLWDNRCTQHLAIDDYAGKRRVMHRITIQGDRPC